MDALRLLLVEDSTDDAALLVDLLRRGSFEPVVERVQTAEAMRRALEKGGWDLVISDYNLPTFDAPTAFQVLIDSRQDIPFIVASGSVGEETAVRMMKVGAHDYVLKQNPDRLIPAVRRELREAENRRQKRLTEEARQRLENERRELLERLKQENEDLTALTQITANAISSLEIDELLETLLDRLVGVLGADAATVLLSDEGKLRVRASRGVAHLSASTYVSSIGEGIAGSVVASSKPIYVEDASTDPIVKDPLIRASGLRTMIGVPLKRNGSTLGVLHAGWLSVRPRRDRDIHILEITAERCGSAIQNARLYKQATDAAAELRASEERFRELADAIDEVFWMTDPERREVLYVSPGYEKVWGRSCASLYLSPREWLDAVHPEDRDRVIRVSRSEAEGGYDTEYRIVRPDGAIRFVRDRAYPVRGPSGDTVRLVGVAEDITTRRTAEEARRASEDRFKAIYEAEPECVKVVGADGIVLEMNPAGLAMIEADSVEEAQRAPLVQLVLPEYRAAFQDLLSRAMAGESGRLEFEVRSLRGSRHWFDTHATPLRDPKGHGNRMLAVTRDITERKKAQEELGQSLLEKEALLKEVHHRVKNNLQLITSLLRLEAGRRGEPGVREVLKDMQGRIQSMALLHETLYRSDRFAAVDLGLYLGQLASQVFRSLKPEAGSIDLELAMTPIQAGIDQAIPCGLLLNELVSNSLKHGFPGQSSGKVSVQLDRVPNTPTVRLRVRDTGAGLPADFALPRGQSLGLQLVSDLTRQLRGTLEIEPGPGASVLVSFPLESVRESPAKEIG